MRDGKWSPADCKGPNDEFFEGIFGSPKTFNGIPRRVDSCTVEILLKYTIFMTINRAFLCVVSVVNDQMHAHHRVMLDVN
ncbi:unnamed protein product, partial [Protopolystoma xenopodis]